MPKNDALVIGAGMAGLAAAAALSEAGLDERVRQAVARAHVADWSADPLARGAYSWEPVGAGDARSVLAQPVQGTLFFAGEATSTDGRAATLQGALASGTRAAIELLATL